MTLLPEFRAQIHHAADQRSRRVRRFGATGWRLPRVDAAFSPVLSVLAAAVTVGVIVVAGLALDGRTTHSMTQRTVQSSGRAADPVWLKRLGQHFAVLNAPTAAPGPVLRQTLTTMGIPQADLRFVHRVVLAAGTVWVVPTQTELCIAFRTNASLQFAAACSPVARAEKWGIRLSEGQRAHLRAGPGPNPIVTYHAGIVPNGTASTQVAAGMGQSIRALIRDNAFVSGPSGIKDRLPPALAADCGSGVVGIGFTVYGCESGAAGTQYAHPGELLVLRANGSYTGYHDSISEPNLTVRSASGEVVAAHNDSLVQVSASALKILVSQRQLDRLLPGSPGPAAIDELAVAASGAVRFGVSYYAPHRHGCANIRAERTPGGQVTVLWRSAAGLVCR